MEIFEAVVLAMVAIATASSGYRGEIGCALDSAVQAHLEGHSDVARKGDVSGPRPRHPIPQTTRKKRSRGSDVIFHGFVGREGSPSFFRAKSNLMK